MLHLHDPIGPEHLAEAAEHGRRLIGIVHGHGEPQAEVHLGGASVGPCDVLGDLADPLLQQRQRIGREEPDGGGQLRRVRDDVARLRTLELGHRDDDGIEDAERPRRHRVQRQRDLGDRGHGVAGGLRLGAVAAGAVDGQVEVGESGHERSALGREATALIGLDVDSIGGDDGHSGGVEETLGDHRLGTALDLLGGLEHEDDRAGDRLPVRGEQPGGADESGRVHIVPAGVHVPVRRGEVEPRLLLHRQRIHVSAQQHRGTGACAPEHGHHRGQALPRRDLEAEAGELVEDGLLRERQVVSEFGVRVQPAAQGDEIAEVALRLGAEIRSGCRCCGTGHGCSFGPNGLCLRLY